MRNRFPNVKLDLNGRLNVTINEILENPKGII